MILPWISGYSQQLDLSLSQDIPFYKEGKELSLALSGGMDSPQINTFDVNSDGREDIVTFDRTSFTLSIFLRQEEGFIYAPEYIDMFPEGLEQWILLRDFNGDGKKDLFTSSPLGMNVYVNISSGEDIAWRLYHSREPGPSPLMTTGFNGTVNLQMNATDIPSIQDLDGDGDTDILVFRFTGSSTVEWHKNMAVERTGTIDSMQFVRETQQWGGFEECDCGDFAFQGEDCGTQPGKVEHEGGKSLLALDWEGDGDPDLIMSEETCEDIYLLENNEEILTNLQKTFSMKFPFPAAYYEDADGDGTSDLLIASNAISSVGIERDFSQTLQVIKNTGTTDNADFSGELNPFLQDEMIDVGSSAIPAFYDVDNDGDLDLFVGSRYTFYEDTPRGSILFFENTGTRSQPAYEWITDDFLSLSDLQLFHFQPQFIDVTLDGRADLVFKAQGAGLGSRLYYLENETQGFSTMPETLSTELSPLDKYSLVDVNRDGVPDLIISRAEGRVELHSGVNEGGNLSFTLTDMDFLGISNNPLLTQGYLTLADISGNGQNDALYTAGNGKILWSADIFPEQDSQFLPLEVENLPERYTWGRNLWLTTANLYNENVPLIIVGTSRGGLNVLKPSQSSPIEERDLLVYPNPVSSGNNGFVSIISQSNIEIHIVNLLGQEMISPVSVPTGMKVDLDVSRIAGGLYLVIGRQGGKVIVSSRLVVME
jgi:hypothetical protein